MADNNKKKLYLRLIRVLRVIRDKRIARGATSATQVTTDDLALFGKVSGLCDSARADILRVRFDLTAFDRNVVGR